jgi:hypothetical protein
MRFATTCFAGMLAVAGCASAPERAILKMQLAREEVAGQPRLFSTYGFWVLEEPVRKRVLACYSPEGVLDRPKLQVIFAEAQMVDIPGCVSLVLPQAVFPSFLLRDGPLISLDPKIDSLIEQLSEQVKRSNTRSPIVVPALL